jgi:alpha-galactosidase
VWRRPDATATTTLCLPHLRGQRIDLDVLYPRHLPAWTCDWDADAGSLTVASATGEPVSARLLRILTTPR